MAIPILILDSNKLFAAGIKYLLEALLSGAQVDHVTSYAEAADRLRTARFVLLIMEIGIARDNGLRVLKRLRTEYSDLPLLVLSTYPTDYYGPKVIRAGACGFIEKESEPEQVLSAVKCVLKGKHYISPDLADRLALGLGVGPNSDGPHERLSPRELQVFRRLALGQSVTCIARSLELSVKTVDTHRTKILRKMGMNDRQELARYAFERGLIASRRLGEGGNRASAALSE